MNSSTPKHLHASVDAAAPSSGPELRAMLIARGIIVPRRETAPEPYWDTSVPTLRPIGNEDTRPQPGRWALRPEGER